MKLNPFTIKRFPVVLLQSILFLLCLGKIALIWTHAVNPDEFAHLHWSYLLFTGVVPYRDFFFHFLPVFHILFFPLFLFPQGPFAIVAGRMIMLLFSFATAYLLTVITRRFTKNPLSPLVSAMIFLLFPMTFDKTIEVRPDMVMTFLGVFCLTLLLPDKNKLSNSRIYIGGILFGTSMLLLLKTVAIIPALLFLLVGTRFRNSLKHVLLFILGTMIPWVFMALYLHGSGIFNLAIISLTVGSQAVKAGEGTFSPILTLSPWPLIYNMHGGISVPWITNSLAIFFGLGGLLLFVRKNRHVSVSGILWLLGSIGMIFLFQTPYPQYFILPSVIIALGCGLTADLFLTQGRSMKTKLLHTFFWIGILSCGVSFYEQFTEREGAIEIRNEQFQVIRDIVRITAQEEHVYDMTGSYIFRRDGYYICCNTYSQFTSLLPWKLPTLESSLRNSNTRFIILDNRGLAFWRPNPPDLAFIFSHYIPSAYKKIYTAGSTYTCQNNVCQQINTVGIPIMKNSVTLDIAFPDAYEITTVPAGQTAIIGDTLYKDKDVVRFVEGMYPIRVSPFVTSLTVQIKR